MLSTRTVCSHRNVSVAFLLFIENSPSNQKKGEKVCVCGGGGGGASHHYHLLDGDDGDDGDDCSWPWILTAVHSANFQLCQDRLTLLPLLNADGVICGGKNDGKEILNYPTR